MSMEKGGPLEPVMQRLFRRHRFGIKPGLEVEQALLARLGNPQDGFGAIHVTGTNGKGSVCAIVSSILRAAGVRAGLYTSPHLVDFSERIVVDGKAIDVASLADGVVRVEPMADLVAGELGQEPTFFECATAIGFDYFRRAGVKLAVVEVGMGGRLDATNVVMPLVSVITRISLEHQAYLGDTLEAIAREKGGIIKPGRPVVCGAMCGEAMDTIRAIARERGSPLFEAAELVSVTVKRADVFGQKVVAESGSRSFGEMLLPLAGRHQLENLATALAVVETLGDSCGLPIDERTVKRGIEAVRWPARFDVVSRDPLMIVDGAHNPGAADVLASTLRQLLKKKPLGFIVGMCNDKDYARFLRAFDGLVRKAWVVPLATERSTPVGTIAGAARGMGWDVQESTLEPALAEAMEWARACGGAVCIAGSLYLAGEALERLATKEGMPG